MVVTELTVAELLPGCRIETCPDGDAVKIGAVTRMRH